MSDRLEVLGPGCISIILNYLNLTTFSSFYVYGNLRPYPSHPTPVPPHTSCLFYLVKSQQSFWGPWRPYPARSCGSLLWLWALQLLGLLLGQAYICSLGSSSKPFGKLSPEAIIGFYFYFYLFCCDGDQTQDLVYASRQVLHHWVTPLSFWRF